MPQPTTTSSNPSGNPKLDAALEYAGRGWAVFPCQPKKKQPLTAHGLKDASTDPEQIRAWWTECPEANVAIATGERSGVTVLDVDVKPWKNAHGDETLAALIAERGALPLTRCQQTWSGGLQYLFAYAAGVRNSAGKVGPHLDIRGGGGYIVVPPSVVEDDGQPEGTYSWVNEAEPAPMPEWLLERIKTAGGKQSKARSTNAPAWVDEYVDGAPDGSRDHTCVRLLGRYSQMRPPLSKAEITRLLSWAEASLDHEGQPFPAETVLEKIDRLFNAMAHELVDYPLTDAGNAERTIALYGDRFRWVPSGDRGEWLAWDGLRWAPGSTDVVRRYALETARATQAAAVRLDKDERRGGNSKKAILRHALDSEEARNINPAVQLARIVPGVVAKAEALDTHPFLLNVTNGTLDLRTGQLRRPEPQDMLTQAIAVPYDPAAPAPRWGRFLHEIFLGKQDVIDYVQRAVGYTLTGGIEEQCFFLLHGGGENGKSTFIGVLSALLGEYAVKLDQEAVLFAEKNRGRGASPEIMRLRGKRLAFVDEMERDRALDEARIKALTGSEQSSGRNLYEGTREFRNTAKVWFDLNDLPAFTGVDRGIARRPRVIPFDRRFSPEEQDKTLLEALKEELPGILAWAVKGCLAWQQDGLRAPESVDLVTRAYVEEQNHLPVFLRESYAPDPRGRVSGSDLQAEYQGFCVQRGEEPMSWQRQVTPFLRSVAKLRHERTKHGKLWLGLRRLDPTLPESSDARTWPV
jgi:putative DNA primase/helicase